MWCSVVVVCVVCDVVVCVCLPVVVCVCVVSKPVNSIMYGLHKQHTHIKANTTSYEKNGC